MELQGLYDIYLIHDNGGIPFEVLVDEETKHVLVRLYDTDESYESSNINPPAPILDIKYTRIFLGGKLPNEFIDNGYDFDWGNSVLIHLLDDKYIYVGSQIYEFTSPLPILEYFSPIGNNDVPYPFARSCNETFLMIEDVVLDNELLRQEQEKFPTLGFCPYKLYYKFGYGFSNDRLPVIRKIDAEIIQKRL